MKACCRILVLTGLMARAGPAPAQTTLPAAVIDDRFFLRPVTTAGDTLDFYTDTGGGLFVRAELLARLGIHEAADSTVALAQFGFTTPIPDPLGSPGRRLPVRRGPVPQVTWDGLLGQAWFSGRVWVFDYPGRKLQLLPSPPAMDPAHTVALGFQTDATGRRTTSFARVPVEIDGDSLDLLFDTGAMVLLTGDASRALGEDAGICGTSFITTEVFLRWRERHPDWETVANADSMVRGMALIRVPQVTVAGHRVGPVWFTQRPDRNFHQFMSQRMDRRVDGALGGSALRNFRVTVDYVGGRAHFER